MGGKSSFLAGFAGDVEFRRGDPWKTLPGISNTGSSSAPALVSPVNSWEKAIVINASIDASIDHVHILLYQSRIYNSTLLYSDTNFKTLICLLQQGLMNSDHSLAVLL